MLRGRGLGGGGALLLHKGQGFYEEGTFKFWVNLISLDHIEVGRGAQRHHSHEV